jgi:hypothetical protein
LKNLKKLEFTCLDLIEVKEAWANDRSLAADLAVMN